MKRIFVAALLGFAVGLPASAQPMHDGTPLEMLGALRGQLNLNTSQQQQWDNAVALSASVHDALRASFQQRQAALQAELAKAEPDFASIASASDSAHARLGALHKQARDAWLALYATFSPEQKAIARDAIKTKIDQIQARRAAHRRGAAAPS
ncbi:MAG TPA: periplasmic heavy metal sensor [Casimicrobiaceae bacterium]|nr:periplasmic heavy metal sensor [Casimicrobiaceae bacterium]